MENPEPISGENIYYRLQEASQQLRLQLQMKQELVEVLQRNKRKFSFTLVGNVNNNGNGSTATTFESGWSAGRFWGAQGFRGVVYIAIQIQKIHSIRCLSLLQCKIYSVISFWRSGFGQRLKSGKMDRFEIRTSLWNNVNGVEKLKLEVFQVGRIFGCTTVHLWSSNGHWSLPIAGGQISTLQIKQIGLFGRRFYHTVSPKIRSMVRIYSGTTDGEYFPKPTNWKSTFTSKSLDLLLYIPIEDITLRIIGTDRSILIPFTCENGKNIVNKSADLIWNSKAAGSLYVRNRLGCQSAEYHMRVIFERWFGSPPAFTSFSQEIALF